MAKQILRFGSVATVTNTAAKMGVMGAIVGGAVTAVQDSYKIARGEMKTQEAIGHTAKEAVGTGVASATAAAAVSALGLGGLVGLGGFLILGSLVKGVWDSASRAQASEAD
jgi:hypothetical protein